jgi:hypothetical protein
MNDRCHVVLLLAKDKCGTKIRYLGNAAIRMGPENPLTEVLY